MAVRRVFVPIAALCGIGATLLFVPLFSSSVPAILAIPLTAFWSFAWCLDALFTARNWRLVLDGCETNVVLLAISRIAPKRAVVVFAAHAAFSVGVAAGLQALVTHSLDYFAMSCVLAVFGVLHFDAFRQSRIFVMKVAEAEEQRGAGKKVW